MQCVKIGRVPAGNETHCSRAFLRLFISPPECEAHWSCSSPPTTRPPEREADRERRSQTAYAAGY